MGIEAKVSKIVDSATKEAKHVADGVAKVARDAGDKVGDAANVAKSIVPGGEKSPVSEDQIMDLLDICYSKAVDGVPKISKPLEELVEDYKSQYSTVEDAAKAMINMQLIKNTTSGFLSGLGGALTLPVALAAIPANISNVLYVQLRMVAALADMGGYDVESDQVQTLVYTCLTGSAATDILKEAGINIAEKLTIGAIKKIPGATLTKINQKVGFRLVTKFGEKGAVNLGKLVPVIGGVVGGAFDFSTTRVIANVAYNLFIGKEKDNVISDSTIEIIEDEYETDMQAINEDMAEK